MRITHTLAALTFLLPIMMGAAGDQNAPAPAHSEQNSTLENSDSMNNTLVIKIGDKEFTATLFDNPTAAAFKTLLPLTINMTELNGNEKYFRLSKNLPANESNPGGIKSGDLMLYGSNTLVVFYKAFPTSYSYSRLGKINDATGLATALGTGSVTVIVSSK
jgi:hypothetical protein